MLGRIRRCRRAFLGTLVGTITAAGPGGIARAEPRSADGGRSAAGAASFGPRKRVEAGVLSVEYVEAGPAGGPAVILLHGWPYDFHSYADATPLLAERGFRVIVPYLRGYGGTRFISSAALRNGGPAAVALDLVALMDALHIETAILAGFDWGARTADIVAALWPQRCRALVCVSGYLISSQALGETPLPPRAELAWWYHLRQHASPGGGASVASETTCPLIEPDAPHRTGHIS